MADIPALVIIDLGAKKVAVYRMPTDGTYRRHDVLRSDDRLQIPDIAAAHMRVGDLFDRARTHPSTSSINDSGSWARIPVPPPPRQPRAKASVDNGPNPRLL